MLDCLFQPMAKGEWQVAKARHSTGVPGLDELLGGGLIPGTLTVVAGATGIGKTQLGLQYLHAGAAAERRPGLLFDVSARGDSQNHAAYAERMFGWQLPVEDADAPLAPASVYDLAHAVGHYLHIFDYRGRRVTKRDLDFDQWHDWQAELNRKLERAIAFFYGNFVRGARRVVVDGVEPSDTPSDSIQLNLFEYVYHQILRKDPEWVARDLFRADYRAHAEAAAQFNYPTSDISCLLLYTSRDVMLDDLIARRIDEGDALSNANTLIYMGKTRAGNKVGRALHIAKHRGSACDDGIIPYAIDERGLRVS
jgi:KaiC/GvpD/RAD55 family RecA-like ATPase